MKDWVEDAWLVNRRTAVVGGVAAAWGAVYAQDVESRPDAARFFRAPETLSAHFSPDGNWVALRTIAKHGGVALSVVDLTTMTPRVLHSQENADASEVCWASDTILLFSIENRNAPQAKLDAGPGLFAIHADGSGFRQLVERQDLAPSARIESDPGIASVRATGAAPKGAGPAPAGQEGMGFKQIKDAPNVKNVLEIGVDRVQPWDTYLVDGSKPSSAEQIAMWRARPGSRGAMELLQVNPVTGRAKLLELPGEVMSAHLGADGEILALVTREDAGRSVWWRTNAQSAWRKLPGCSPEPDIDWGIQHVDADSLYLCARRGRDTVALWSYSPAADAWSGAPVLESGQFDLVPRPVLAHGKLAGWRFYVDAEVTQWIDAGLKDAQATLDKLLPSTVNRISAPLHGASPWLLVDAFSDRQPNVHLLFQRQTGKLTKLGSLRPDITAKQMNALDRKLVSRQGDVALPVWVMRPRSAKDQAAPVVVWLGDAASDVASRWEWHEVWQFFAMRGFAVVKPELRGTRGLGARYRLHKQGSVGLGAIDDAQDAARWAIAQGIADPKRIAIVGSGVGAALGLAAMARDPAAWACGVAWGAVTSATQLESSQGQLRWGASAPQIQRALLAGDVRTATAATSQPTFPPVQDALMQPLLMAHGQRDSTVPIAQGQALFQRVAANKAASQWVSYPEEGHVLRAPANRVDFLDRMAAFLERSMGV
jgi:dienelactone hydrolase